MPRTLPGGPGPAVSSSRRVAAGTVIAGGWGRRGRRINGDFPPLLPRQLATDRDPSPPGHPKRDTRHHPGGGQAWRLLPSQRRLKLAPASSQRPSPNAGWEAVGCHPTGATAGPGPPSSTGAAAVRVRGSRLQHRGRNLLLRLCGAGYGISMETLPLRLRSEMPSPRKRAGQPGQRRPGTGSPRPQGCRYPGHPWPRGDRGESDSPPRPKGPRGSGTRSAGHPCPQHGCGRGDGIGGTTPEPQIPAQTLLSPPHPLRSVPRGASRPRRVLRGLNPSPTLGPSWGGTFPGPRGLEAIRDMEIPQSQWARAQDPSDVLGGPAMAPCSHSRPAAREAGGLRFHPQK